MLTVTGRSHVRILVRSSCRKPGDRLDRWNWWTQFNSGRVYPLELDFQRLVYTAVLK